MRKTLVLTLACAAILALIVSPLPTVAQEKKDMAAEAMSMAPPPPLADDFFTWMIGEWEGWTTSSMGKSQDWQKIEWGLDKQFTIMHYTGKTTEMNPEFMKGMMESAKMSKADMDKMKNMVYKGMGVMTLNPMNNEFAGHWFDNWRATATGKGKREGNIITTTWESPMGTEMRTIEKVSEDKMVMTFKMKDSTGKETEGRTEFIRKKAAPKKT